MSNETSRVEAAALVIDPAPWRSEHPASLARRNVIRDTATAALAAADADDLANGIRRVRVDEDAVEKVAAESWDAIIDGASPWSDLDDETKRIHTETTRAVLAAATDGADG